MERGYLGSLDRDRGCYPPGDHERLRSADRILICSAMSFSGLDKRGRGAFRLARFGTGNDSNGGEIWQMLKLSVPAADEEVTVTCKTTVDDFLAQPTLAVVGVSRDSKAFANGAYKELKEKGYRLLPVNPHMENSTGSPAIPASRRYPNLRVVR